MKSQDERIAKMTFASVYPHYVAKVLRKGKTEKELLFVIEWLTGFNKEKIFKLINENANFTAFFEEAQLNPRANEIKGTICGIRIENIENPLTQKVRYLDKLVDDLANGRKMKFLKE